MLKPFILNFKYNNVSFLRLFDFNIYTIVSVSTFQSHTWPSVTRVSWDTSPIVDLSDKLDIKKPSLCPSLDNSYNSYIGPLKNFH